MSSGQTPWIKICGVTCEDDALLVVAAGADAIGLNFVESSKRRVDVEVARRVADRVRGEIELVGVVVDRSAEELGELSRAIGLDWLQLHGSESPEFVAALPRAFKAVGVERAEDVARAASYPGERLLVDTKSQGVSGGTGQIFDWSLVDELCRARRVIVAGGLTPENVADAMRRLRPFGVDVAGGVERQGEPRRKDAERVRAFVTRARAASLP